MGIYDYSQTAGDNTAVGGVSVIEGMSPAGINNAIRAEIADVAKWRDDTGGALTAGGSANALTLTTNSTIPELADGVEIGFVAASSNTGAATLNVDSLGAKALRKITSTSTDDTALAGNDIRANGHYTVRYDESANSATGAWILVDTTLPDFAAINALSAITDPAADDEAAVYDVSEAVAAKITLANLLKVITDLTAETAPAVDDELALYDTSGTATDKITLANLFKVFALLTAETAIAADDILPISDTSASAAAKAMTIANFANFVSVLTELAATPDHAADYLLISDAGTAAKKILAKRIGAGAQPLPIAASSCQPTTTLGAIAYANERGTTNVWMATGYEFANGVVSRIQTPIFQMPASWDGGALTVSFSWMPKAAGMGVVRWGVRAMCLTNDDAIDTAGSTIATVDDTRIATDDIHITSTVSVTPSNSPAGGKLIIIEFSRRGSAAEDTLAQPAVLLSVNILYTTTQNTEA